MRREVTTVDELREIVGEPDPYVANKVKDRLSAGPAATGSPTRRWVSSRRPTPAAVSTSHRRATRRASSTSSTTPRSRSRNGRATSGSTATSTCLQRPHVGTLFLIPGRGDTLRINGTARILADADYFDAMAVKGKRPILALEIDIEEVFFHCAKAFCAPTPGTRRPGTRPRCPASRRSRRPFERTGAKPNSRSTTAKRTTARCCTD